MSEEIFRLFPEYSEDILFFGSDSSPVDVVGSAYGAPPTPRTLGTSELSVWEAVGEVRQLFPTVIPIIIIFPCISEDISNHIR